MQNTYMQTALKGYYLTFTFTDKTVGGSKLHIIYAAVTSCPPRHVCTIIQVR